MSGEKAPSEMLDRYIVRLPDGMRDQIKERASNAGRSMNAEIVQILKEKLTANHENSEEPMPSAKAELGQIVIRPPEGIRERIKDSADANGRSMNSEIILALQAHLDGKGTGSMRDRFAEAALVGLPQLCAKDTLLDGLTFEQHVARNAYKIADAMMAERERSV